MALRVIWIILVVLVLVGIALGLHYGFTPSLVGTIGLGILLIAVLARQGHIQAQEGGSPSSSRVLQRSLVWLTVTIAVFLTAFLAFSVMHTSYLLGLAASGAITLVIAALLVLRSGEAA